MAEDVKEGIVKVVVDRVANPLLFGFAISWCFINYQFFILVVKINDYGKLVKILKNDLFSDVGNYQFLWFDVSRCLHNGILLPAGLSFLYVFLSPVLMIGVTWWQLFCESYLRKIKNYFDAKFARTREEFERLEDSLKEMTVKREGVDLKNAELRVMIDKVIEERDSSERNREKIIENYRLEKIGIVNELEGVRAELSECKKMNVSRGVEGEPESNANDLAYFYAKYSSNYSSLLSPFARVIFEKIVKNGGEWSGDYVPSIGMSQLKFSHEVDMLVRDGLINRDAMRGLYITQTGRKIGVELEDFIASMS